MNISPDFQFILAMSGFSAIIYYAWWRLFEKKFKAMEVETDEAWDRIVVKCDHLKAERDDLRADRDRLRAALRIVVDRGRRLPEEGQPGKFAGVSANSGKGMWGAVVAAGQGVSDVQTP